MFSSRQVSKAVLSPPFKRVKTSPSIHIVDQNTFKIATIYIQKFKDESKSQVATKNVILVGKTTFLVLGRSLRPHGPYLRLKPRNRTGIRKAIRHPKRSSRRKIPSSSDTTTSEPPNPHPKDDQKELYLTIDNWLESIKDAPAPGHRFNGHTLGKQRLTQRNLAMLDAGLRPMPVFGPEKLTRENLEMFSEEMGPLESVWEMFGFDVPEKFVEGDVRGTSESGATTGSSRLSA
ncbi:hypothetical protein HYFRA_00004520 [Hymenoscyphus fraxineus]|uniref:Uncharacterized protein n=1 Tax=Hymenoscyphus fraxineus TaxID=746836 RepID=A0A9N9KX02_9HELO|nr:hypothetical protein HYFRA_00004520 [Hymenoscyphus fraxineus]